MHNASIKVKRHYSIFSLEKAWKEIESSGSLHVFQEYEVQKALFCHLIFYCAHFHILPAYIEVTDEDKTVLIAPLFQRIGHEEYELIAHMTGFQSTDFIYRRDLDEDKMCSYLKALFDFVGGNVFISRMQDDSMVFRILQKSNMVTKITDGPSVAIKVGNNYADYFANLSKNTRQHIKQAYNRMEKDGMSYRIELVRKRPLNKAQKKAMLKVYAIRRRDRYEINESFLRLFYTRHFDFITSILQNYHDNVYALFYINDELAAFFSGLVDHRSNSIVIPRVAINAEFGRYSPGLLLINESAKQVSETDISTIDLGVGAEPYKFTMGGKQYLTHNFCVQKIV